MRILLDTHVYLWCEQKTECVPKGMLSVLAAPRNELYVSAVTAWEIAIKRAAGKLEFNGSISSAIREQPRFHPLPVTMEHAEQAGSLPLLHRDPFDRLLVAQAQIEGMILATVDDQILRYKVPCLPLR